MLVRSQSKLTGRDARDKLVVDVNILIPFLGGGVQFVYETYKLEPTLKNTASLYIQCVLTREPGAALTGLPFFGSEPGI